jgi:hypothetical protein
VSNYTHETVPTKLVEAKGIRYAYRRFGKAGKVPLLFLEYFLGRAAREYARILILALSGEEPASKAQSRHFGPPSIPNATELRN